MSARLHTRPLVVLFAAGLVVPLWVAWGFAGQSPLALLMTLLVALAYAVGGVELHRYHTATLGLHRALDALPPPTAPAAHEAAAEAPTALAPWLATVPQSLQGPVRLRVEGERVPLPSPALTPYLVGLLVMLGMLGTFLGLVLTFRGAVFALENSGSLDAVRAALAAPIQGLGLSFGTSVAGVAASAALGLLSALCRRERQRAGQRLDTAVATSLRRFSAAQHQQDLLTTLQAQAQAWPVLAERLQDLAQGLQTRQQQWDERLLAQQQAFFNEARAAHSALAQTVGQDLRHSLEAAARGAGDALAPVLKAAVADVVTSAHTAHERLVQTTRSQWDRWSADWAQSAQTVAQGWTQALAHQAQQQQVLLERLERSLGDWPVQWARQAAEHQKLTQTAMTQTAQDLVQRTGDRMDASVAALHAVLQQTETLVNTRLAGEAQWAAAQDQRTAHMAGVLREELHTLRDAEAQRAQAAADRWDRLHHAMTEHLAQLSAAMEQPMARLMETVSQVPQAASSLMLRVQNDMATLAERDNLASAERNAQMARLGELLAELHRSAQQQGEAVDRLVQSATGVLEQAASRFSQALQAQAQHSDETAQGVAAQITASAVELSSLAEAFGHGVAQFGHSSQTLVHSLQSIEAALAETATRSDEQLAYYVAQAREVVDLSIAAQQGLVEDLRRLHGTAQAAPATAGSAV